MKEELIHILDQSVCLTRRQMKDYLSGHMSPEEMHASEVHLSSCPLCHMAMEGFSEHSDEALVAISELNSGFLKEHFAKITPQIHLNSMAPAASLPRSRRKGHTVSLGRMGAVAATVLLAFGVIWFLKNNPSRERHATIAGRQAPEQHTSPAVTTAPAAGPASAQEAPTVAAAPAPAAKGLVKEAAPAATTATDASPASPVPEYAVAQGGNKEADAARTDGGLSAYGGRVTYTAPAARPATAQTEEKYVSAMPPPAAAEATTDRVSTPNFVEDNQKVVRAMPLSRQPQATAYNAPLKSKQESEAADDSRSHMEQGDDLFEQGKWGSAAQHYREEMGRGSRGNRNQAAIMAARCYLNLGQKQRAIQLLQGVLAEGGPQKRTAKKMLRDLQGGE